MTTRLYYTDSELLEFDAQVVAARQGDGRLAVVLDRTAFYPTSGGQPFDTGVLGDARVLDVVDEGDDILHVVDRPLAVGSAVRGAIDAARRLDHMQQHTGQHLLSAAFDRRFGNRVSELPLSTSAIHSLLHNDKLVEKFTAAGAPVMVRADLVEDNGTKSGLAWTSGKGPDFGIENGTLVSATVTTKRQAPVTLILPFLKSVLGVDG